MSESNIHIDLFTKSGCLTTEALKGYISDVFSDLEKDRIKNHLNSCELCSDALEGLQLISDSHKIDLIVSEIKENLEKTLPNSKGTQSEKFKKQTRLYYFAVAASVLILIGVFSYFRFYWQNQNSEISALIEKPEPKFVEEIKLLPEESGEEEAPSQAANESKPIPPIDIHKEKSDKPVEEVDEILNEIVIEEPIATILSDEQTQYIINGDAMDAKGVSSQDKATNGEIQLNSISAETSPAVAKKSSRKFSVENNSMINPDSISESNSTIFFVVEEDPVYPGGEEAMFKYFQENLVYPDSAKILGIQGKVYVSFLVMKSGKVKNVQIKRGIGGGCDEMALQMIESMPDWIPGKQRGKPVTVQFVLPIEFKLDN